MICAANQSKFSSLVLWSGKEQGQVKGISITVLSASLPRKGTQAEEQIPAPRAAEQDPDFLEPISRWSNVMVTSKRARGAARVRAEQALRKAGQQRGGTQGPDCGCRTLGQTFG